LKELHGKPARITQSSLRTIAHAADVLIALCQEAQDPSEGTPQSGLILAVDDEPISRRVLANALGKASLKTISLDDSQLALRVMQENQFDLIFLDADMPVMNGFELCKQLRALPSNKSTPVVFVTSLNDFESRAQSSLAGGNDLIAKPFLMIELAVKALTYLMKPRLKKNTAPGAGANPASGQAPASGSTPPKPAVPGASPSAEATGAKPPGSASA
jgi:CheY-like chemotaxis protein